MDTLIKWIAAVLLIFGSSLMLYWVHYLTTHDPSESGSVSTAMPPERSRFTETVLSVVRGLFSR